MPRCPRGSPVHAVRPGDACAFLGIMTDTWWNGTGRARYPIPYLNHILEKQVHEALRQRITVHYNYEGLSDQEVPDYIHHKLELAGGSRSILGGDAVSAVHGYSEGNARKIDNLMTDALTIGAQQEKPAIDAEVILAVANNQSLT